MRSCPGTSWVSPKSAFCRNKGEKLILFEYHQTKLRSFSCHRHYVSHFRIHWNEDEWKEMGNLQPLYLPMNSSGVIWGGTSFLLSKSYWIFKHVTKTPYYILSRASLDKIALKTDFWRWLVNASSLLLQWSDILIMKKHSKRKNICSLTLPFS